MRSLIFTAPAALLIASAASAHDFWLQPKSWDAAEPGKLELTFQVGHGAERQRSPIRASRLTVFEAIEPDGSIVDLHPGLHVGASESDASVGELVTSPAMIVLVTDANAQSYLDPRRFNAHLRDDGLLEAAAWRTSHRQTDVEGSENYGRIAKVLIGGYAAAIVTKPVGLELELVPLENPYDPTVNALPVQVLSNGSPIKSATVKLYDLGNDASPQATCQTNAAGTCIFELSRQGSWLANVIWSTSNAAGSVTAFRTIFSSLAFGFDSASNSR